MTYPKEELFTENDIIDPNWVIRYLLNHLTAGRTSSKEVISVVKKMLKQVKGIKITYREDPSVINCFAVSGLFDTETKDSISIEVLSRYYDKKFHLNENFLNHFVCDIADTLCHESIHRYQHQTRVYDEFDGNNPSDEQSLYYSDPDEMFAYGVNIAHNLYRQFGNSIIDAMGDFSNIVDNDYYLKDYHTLFNNQKLFRKLMKMIYLNVRAIDEGKICHRP